MMPVLKKMACCIILFMLIIQNRQIRKFKKYMHDCQELWVGVARNIGSD